MQQKFRMFLYIIRPIGIRVKICDYVNQNTAHSRGIDLSERTVLEMSVITKAGLLALAAVLLLPSAQTTQAAQPEPLIVIVQKRQDAQERTLRVLRDGSVEEAALDTYLAQVVLAEMPASFAPEALKAQAVAARTFACRQTAGGKHENADVCAQSACCQACLTVEDLRARYGDGFEAAWDKALQLAPEYDVAITDELIEESLDTYRDWLHSRSLCPHCNATGVQTATRHYQCLACHHAWRVNEARTCALRRYETKKRP